MSKTDKMNLKEEALAYHEAWTPGKIEVVPTKPYANNMTFLWRIHQVSHILARR